MMKIGQKQVQSQKISPQQILNVNIMQLNSSIIEKKIIDELESNPALDILERVDSNNDSENQDDDNVEWEELLSKGEESYSFKNYQNDRIDYSESFLKNHLSLSDDFLKKLQDINASELELEISEYILGNLDDSGYLTIDKILILDKFNISEKFLEKLLIKIRHLDPPGIASINLQECLLSQLEIFYPKENLAINVIKNYFSDYANHRYSKLVKKINCSKDEMNNVINLISILNPRPGINYSDNDNYSIIPDIIVEMQNEKWVIIENNQHFPQLKINKNYKDMICDKKIDKDTEKFIKQKIQSANWFMNAISNRYSTIVKIMKSIMKHQERYFNSDEREIKPLILKTIAKDINMDLSTISRATKEKYVQLPWGIVELKTFFSEGIKMSNGEIVSSNTVKKEILEIIKDEDIKKPINDEGLASELLKRGYQIARRTVSKYRENLGIPVSRLRKRDI